jgi:hypothetical protein
MACQRNSTTTHIYKAFKVLVTEGYTVITIYTQNYIHSLFTIRGTNRDKNNQDQCPEILLVMLWKGEDDRVFSWNTKFKKKRNLDSLDYTQYFHGLESGTA